MAVPKSVLESIEAAGRRAKQRAKEAQAAAEREEERVAAAVWAWLEGDDVREVKDALAKAGLERITILDQSGLVLALVVGQPGLEVADRTGKEQVGSQADLTRRLPQQVLARLEKLISAEEIWTQLVFET
jgi:hypothetical protein